MPSDSRLGIDGWKNPGRGRKGGESIKVSTEIEDQSVGHPVGSFKFQKKKFEWLEEIIIPTMGSLTLKKMNISFFSLKTFGTEGCGANTIAE